MRRRTILACWRAAALGSRLYARRSEVGEARQCRERAINLFRTYSFHHWFPSVAAGLGHVYVGLGRIDEGIALIEHATSVAERSHLTATSDIGAVVHLAETYLRSGRQ